MGIDERQKCAYLGAGASLAFIRMKKKVIREKVGGMRAGMKVLRMPDRETVRATPWRRVCI